MHGWVIKSAKCTCSPELTTMTTVSAYQMKGNIYNHINNSWIHLNKICIIKYYQTMIYFFRQHSFEQQCSWQIDLAAVRRIAKKVSGRGGGLPSVQSMALVHGDVTEVACNLLEPSNVGGNQVQHKVEALAGEEGVAVGKGYFTDFTQEQIIENYLKLSYH